MTESETQEAKEVVATSKPSRSSRLYVQSGPLLAWTIIYSILGAVIFALASLIPMPFVMAWLFRFGIVPATAVIAVAGAIRGPVAGFLTGYLGTLIYDMISAGVVVTMTVPAAAWGILGLIVGLTRYDFTKGRSLAKLSVMSVVAYVVALVILLLIGLRVEIYPTLAAMVFFLIPMLTAGIPSVFLLSPIYARAWYVFTAKARPSQLVS